jgi:hypothetical protein
VSSGFPKLCCSSRSSYPLGSVRGYRRPGFHAVYDHVLHPGRTALANLVLVSIQWDRSCWRWFDRLWDRWVPSYDRLTFFEKLRLTSGQIKGALASWRYEFLIVGAVCAAWGIALFWLLPNSPATFRGFTHDEKLIMIARMRKNQTGIEGRRIKWHQIREAFTDYKTYLFMVSTLSLHPASCCPGNTQTDRSSSVSSPTSLTAASRTFPPSSSKV